MSGGLKLLILLPSPPGSSPSPSTPVQRLACQSPLAPGNWYPKQRLKETIGPGQRKLARNRRAKGLHDTPHS